MIKTGTKVIVLSSSCRKKTGPRKGSIGFISQVRQHGSEISYVEKGDVFVNLTKVVFTRYGFESKERMELKYFINVFPTFLERRTMNMPLLENSVDIMKTDQHSVHYFKQRLSDMYGKAATTAYSGIIMPIITTDNIMDLSSNDFNAWLYSILRDQVFISLVDNISDQARRVRGLIDMGELRALFGALHDGSRRKTMMEELRDNMDMKNRLVNLIRKIEIIGNRSGHKRKIERTLAWVEQRKIRSNSDLIEAGYIIMENMYSRTELLWKFDAIKRYNKNLPGSMKTLSHVFSVRNRLLEIGQSMSKAKSSEEKEHINKRTGAAWHEM